MFPDEIQLVFFKNCLEELLPWQFCWQDPSLAPTKQHQWASIYSEIQVTHLDILWKEERYEPQGISEVLPLLSLMGMVSQQEGGFSCLGVGGSSPRRGPAGVKELPRPRHSGQLGVKEESTVHLPQYKLDGCLGYES